MKLTDLGEFAFIDRIADGCLAGRHDHVLQGIGDDAAVIEGVDGVLLVTTDMMIERVHFQRGACSPFQLGYKALAVNLSDIAAMGGSPADAWVSVAVPHGVDLAEMEEFYDGMKSLARTVGVNILGGDTSRSKQDLCINVLLTGTARRNEVLYRSAAKPGDVILVTGTLGDAAGGLTVLRDTPQVPEDVAAPVLRALHEPDTYLREARIFATSGRAHAAIDLSDGLASDLGHLCKASAVGALVDLPSLPISDELRRLCNHLHDDPLHFALTGGEDYRLLVTVADDHVELLRRRIQQTTGRSVWAIGEIVAGQGIQLRYANGSTQELTSSGWDHFAER